MRKVNPPQVRIPESFARDRDVFTFATSVKDVLYQLWIRTGGGDDLLSSLSDKFDSDRVPFLDDRETSRKINDAAYLTDSQLNMKMIDQQIAKAMNRTTDAVMIEGENLMHIIRKLEQKIKASLVTVESENLTHIIRRLEQRIKDLELR